MLSETKIANHVFYLFIYLFIVLYFLGNFLLVFKETKNFERRFDEMLTRIDNIERNIYELTELKNTT